MRNEKRIKRIKGLMNKLPTFERIGLIIELYLDLKFDNYDRSTPVIN